MSDFALAGAVVYAKNPTRLGRFYAKVLLMNELHADPEYTLLRAHGMELVVHGIPRHIASTFEIATPPLPREDTPIKLFFTVPSIENALQAASSLGGAVRGQPWRGEGFVACDAMDPEGNVFQVRERVA